MSRFCRNTQNCRDELRFEEYVFLRFPFIHHCATITQIRSFGLTRTKYGTFATYTTSDRLFVKFSKTSLSKGGKKNKTISFLRWKSDILSICSHRSDSFVRFLFLYAQSTNWVRIIAYLIQDKLHTLYKT